MVHAAVMLLVVLAGVECSTVSLEMLVYSGTANPTVELTGVDARSVLSSQAAVDTSCILMGYSGIRVRGGGVDAVVRGDKNLLMHFAGAVPPHVINHALERLSQNVTQKCPPPSSLPHADECTETPIRAPNTPPPTYNPSSDDGGCFITEQSKNNCYNYANDIVTNTFAQPGRGSGEKWNSNTCEDIKASAIRDGLVWHGDGEVPSSQPSVGHYVAMLIWPNTNFHWIRMDADLTWSHKPGGTAVRNVDNTGKKITDPSKSDFSPWTTFCGYFQALPANVTIS